GGLAGQPVQRPAQVGRRRIATQLGAVGREHRRGAVDPDALAQRVVHRHRAGAAAGLAGWPVLALVSAWRRSGAHQTETMSRKSWLAMPMRGKARYSTAMPWRLYSAIWSCMRRQ